MEDRNFVTRLLKQSILTLCREAVKYSVQLEIDGIVSVTVDGNAVHVVKIHELFLKQGGFNRDESDNSTETHERSRKRPNIEQVTRVPEVHYDNSQVAVKQELPEVTDTDSNEGNRGRVTNHDNATENGEENITEKETRKVFLGTNGGSPSAQVETFEAQLQRLPISKEIDIPCKKCSDILPDVYHLESHYLKVHSQHICRVCLATFTSRNNMKRHIRIHTGIKPYSCKQCMESFARNDDYKRHILRHTFNKPFRCSICYAGYSDRSCIKTHMIKEHIATAVHICPQCGETFSDFIMFQQHKNIHPELNDYNCTLCSFTGSNGLTYNKHMLTHGPPKVYKCDHCEVTFGNPFNYTNHLKLHKGDDLVQSFGCCFCDLPLPSFEHFQRHEHSHVQARQHTCNICNKQFRYPSSLREHLTTHMSKDNGKESDNQGSDKGRTRESADRELDVDSNESRDQEQIEMNNNNVDIDKGVVVSSKRPAYVLSNDYWCTECNHGFETEGMLQTHIMNTHEAGNEGIRSNEPEDVADDLESHRSTPAKQSLSPYEALTQVDDYDDVYNESTQQDTPEFRKGNRDYDEDTLVDDDDKYRKDLLDDSQNKPEVGLTPAEMAITANAVEQVLAIQQKFGISSQARPRKNIWARPMPPASRNSLLPGSSIFTNSIYIYPPDVSGKRYPSSDPRPMGASKGQMEITKRPYSVLQAGLRSRAQQRKLAYTREPDENAMDMDINQSSSREGSRSPVLFGQLGAKDDINAAVFPNQPPSPYAKTSVLGMVTDLPTKKSKSKNESPTSLNLKVRNPGFEKVITPDILFKTKAPFTCEVCEETFQDFESFDRHGVSVHRRFICSYCGKVFTSRPNRERHVRYHTGEKPYRCELCAMSFFRGDDLKYHRTTRHPEVKPFVCGVCTSTYAQAKDLEKHLKTYPDHRT